MSPESQKSSLGVISDIAAFAIAVNPSVLLKFLGPEKILKIYFRSKSLQHQASSVLNRAKQAFKN